MANQTRSATIARHLPYALLLVACAVPPPPMSDRRANLFSASTTGRTPGSFQVTHDGVARYSIPLWVPPGRGLEPGLSLEYASGGANGLLGEGWSLSGLSRITRCPRTVAQDGAAGPIHWDSTDRLCLDGQRLVAVRGAYGAVGTEYRTELDSFTKVVATGPQDVATGIAFVAWAKDGRILSYGFTPDRAWSLKRVEDRSGNDLQIDYQTDPAFEGEVLPLTISYMRGVTDPGTSKRPAVYDAVYTRFVRFAYEDRPDPSDSYFANQHIVQAHRLRQITMQGPAPTAIGTLRTYELAYATSSITHTSQLAALQECESVLCMPPTTFSYEAGDLTFKDIDTDVPDVRSGTASPENQWVWMLNTGDIDGDGRDDILYRVRSSTLFGRWYYRLSTGSGFGPAQVAAGLPEMPIETVTSGSSGQLVDFNLDGKADFAMWMFDSIGRLSRNLLYSRTATGYQALSDPSDELGNLENADSPPRDIVPAIYAADMKGHGYPDVMRPFFEGSSKSWHIRFNLGGTLSADRSVGVSTVNNTPSYVVDLDGDGRSELITQARPGDPYGATSFDDATLTPTGRGIYLPGDDTRRVFADVTGDGLPDLITYPPLGGAIQLAINHGGSFLTPYPITPSTQAGISRMDAVGIDGGMRVIDYDQDGRSDLLEFHAGPTGARVLRSRGDGSFEPIDLPIPIGSAAGDLGWKTSKLLDADGDGQTDFVQVVGGSLHLYQRTGKRPNLLTRVVDGLGQTTTIEYRPLSDRTVYQAASPGACVDQYCVRGGMWVVSWHRVTSPSTVEIFTHTYKDGRSDLTGRGFVGFAEHAVTDLGHTSTTTYKFQNTFAGPGTSYPYARHPSVVSTITTLVGGSTYRRDTTIGWDLLLTATGEGGSPLFVYPKTMHAVETDTDGSAAVVDWSRAVDAYGNNTLEAYTTKNHVGRRTTTFAPRPDVWLLDQPTRTEDFSRAADGTSVTRLRRFTNDPTTGMTTDIWQEPDANSAQTYLHTALEYDGTGALVRTTATDLGGTTRTTSYGYGTADHTFVTSTLNALRQETKQKFHPGLGVVLSEADANGVTTSTSYDGFGRPTLVKAPDGGNLTITYNPSPYGALAVRTTRDGGGDSTLHYDVFGRVVMEQGVGYDGRRVFVRTLYDNLGRVAEITQPYFENTIPLATQYSYDQADRLLTVKHFDGPVEQYQPALFRPCVLDARGHRQCQTRDEIGLTTEVLDYDDQSLIHKTTYAYAPFELLSRITDERGNVTAHDYDVLGRRIAFDDPDSGKHTSYYNGLGELTTSYDGRGRSTTYRRDALGRLLTVLTPDGAVTNVWDGPNGVGQLSSSTSSGGIQTDWRYDQLGRIIDTTWTIQGTRFSIGQSYDNFGRTTGITYPTVGSSRPAIKVDYAASGQLHGVKSSAGLPYWQVDTRNAASEPTQETFGNGAVTRRQYWAGTGSLYRIDTTAQGVALQGLQYIHDGNQNLTQRNDSVAGTSEQFGYDHLDRLQSWSWTRGTDVRQQRFFYDDIGNLLSIKVDSGPGVTRSFTYGGPNGGPHAVTGSSAGSYTYDGNGAQITGPGRQVGFMAFDLPGSVTTPTRTYSFKYDSANARVLASDSAGNTTISVGGLYERRTTPTGTRHVLLIPGESSVIAEVVMTEKAGNVLSSDVTYFHADHLGSIDQTSDSKGVSRGRSTFTPFGQRTSAAPADVIAGFTGHEHDDDLGLVNMKGRMYDPAIGRFLTRDPVIQAPFFSQSLNPYSYVLNNPLTLTDPSGFEFGDEDPDGGPPPPPDGGVSSPGGVSLPGGTTTGGGSGIRTGQTIPNIPGYSAPPLAPPPPPATHADDVGAAAPVIYVSDGRWDSPLDAFVDGLKVGAGWGLTIAYFHVSGGTALVRLGWSGLRYGAGWAAPRVLAGAGAAVEWVRSQARGKLFSFPPSITWGGKGPVPTASQTRQSWYPETGPRALQQAPRGEAGNARCPTCGEDISKPYVIQWRDGTSHEYAGYQLDHFGQTWQQRVDRIIENIRQGVLTKWPSAEHMRWLYNLCIRAQCQPCNSSHRFECIPGDLQQVYPPRAP